MTPTRSRTLAALLLGLVVMTCEAEVQKSWQRP